MLVPLTWLSEFVDLPADPAALAERLTVAGLEVTAVRAAGVPLPAGLRAKPGEDGIVWDRDKVLVGRVLKIEKHPQADTLKMVTVDLGTGTPKTVITGALNVSPGESGQSVVVGLNGSHYFSADKAGNRAVLTLAPKALRGIENDAMCMSDYELGLSEDHAGIIILDDGDAAPGTPAQDVLGGVTLDVDVLPNMARCLGLAGIAQEVSALTGAPVRAPEMATLPTSGEAAVEVSIADARLCPRYTATVVRGLTNGPAPRVARSRLRAVGQRPVDAVVDVTNLVMFEVGQPLHTFDFDALARRAGGGGVRVTVRPAAAGEVLVTLDGTERVLTPDNLVIADAAGPVALAGVMGGRDTAVTAGTTAVLLESATFDPVSVRKTARQFNLFSESSARFSRGLHPASAETGARRALKLLADFAGGVPVGPTVDAYPAPLPERTVELNRSEIERVLGVAVPDDDVERVLTALGFRLSQTFWGWSAVVPPGRLDIQTGPADLIEDVARVVGYARLPERLLPFELPTPTPDRAADLEDRVRDLLADAGLFEAVTYSLSSPAAEWKLIPPATPVKANLDFVTLLNPTSPDRSVMRRSLLPGLLAVAADNLRHAGRVAAFECGPVYLPRDGQVLPAEPRRLAVVLAGARAEAAWDAPAAAGPADYFDLKGVLDGLFSALHLSATYAPAADAPHLHPGRSAHVHIDGTAVGTAGELHPQVAKAYGFKAAPVAAELDLDALLGLAPDRFAYRPVSPFEVVTRDVAAVVPEATPADRVEAEITAAGAGLLESVKLFDVYRGDSVPAGTKSLAYALTYRTPNRELSTKDVDTAHKKVEGRLRHVLGAKIRGQDV